MSHFRIVHEINSGTWVPGHLSTNAVILAIILAAVGLGMAAYLILVR